MIERNAWVEINLKAIAHNLGEARKKLATTTKLCAVVKADAYGHGAVPVAKTVVAAGADFLAVALLQEGIEIREAGITTPILILGALQKEYAETVVAYDLSQAVFTLDGAKALAAAGVKLGKPAKIHLAVETGMNRIGKPAEEIGEFIAAIKHLPALQIEGIFSHFATADIVDKTFDSEQYRRFQIALAALAAQGIEVSYKHIANSASLSEEPSVHLDMVRQGITLYGLWPSEEIEHNMDLWPAMRVKAQVTYVKELQAGETVGYGRTFLAQQKTKIATLPLGYADGISRKLSNKGYIIIRGKKAPIVGKICMDQFMVDVTEIPEVTIGEEALIFGGAELPAELFAEWMDTINYEAMCLMSKRMPRKYLE